MSFSAFSLIFTQGSASVYYESSVCKLSYSTFIIICAHDFVLLPLASFWEVYFLASVISFAKLDQHPYSGYIHSLELVRISEVQFLKNIHHFIWTPTISLYKPQSINANHVAIYCVFDFNLLVVH